MSVRRSIIVLSVVSLMLPAVFFAVRANYPQRASSPTENLQLYTVSRGDLETTVSAIGQIEPEQIADLSFRSTGRLLELNVAPGDVVMQGQVLASLANEAQQLAVERAQLSLELAQLQKDQLLAGPDAAQIAAAEASVMSAQGAANAAANAISDADIQAAQLAYDAALQALTDAQTARSTAPGGQPQASYDLLDAQVGEASFNAEIARLQLEQLQNGSSPQVGAAYAQVDQAQAALDQLVAGPTDAQIAQADAQIAQAQVSLERAQRQLEQTQLTAPFDGIVTAIYVERGAMTAPGMPVITLIDTDPFHLSVQVDEIDIGEIAEAMPARIRIDAIPDLELHGTLDRIALMPQNINGIVNYDVEVMIMDSDSRVRTGMTAEAAFVTGFAADVLIVPSQYIRLDRAGQRAFVNLLLPDNTLQETEVQLGMQGRDVSEITAGLREGDVIAVDLSGDSFSMFGS